ncbi:MAG: hypothetical protein A2086_14290 [Spirochaetes bacterium GWD1_27_9]|nr:MAG: hypothetical protein A2Z98_02025 [Spirochaetes bacterium GWB1_27_13]OHD20150.1 MAG: hypothetical protein A2Y34_12645 [Spirochaetes bacterium GWC1_27_15]OHD33126.1 MAG: hypothetical protein A2086_14290 [Spirochaetes bacterium GWD1_27_9]
MKKFFICLSLFVSAFLLNSQNNLIVITGSSFGDSSQVLNTYSSIKNNISNDNFFLFDTGDILGMETLASYTSGDLPASIISSLNYHGISISNHEFDYNPNTLKILTDKYKLPFISANIKVDGIDCPEYSIIEGKTKIGFFALTELQGRVPYKIKEIDPIKAANQVAIKLKEAGCKKIICFGTLTGETGIKIIKEIQDIDYVFIGKWNEMDSYKSIDGRGVYFVHNNDYLVYNPENDLIERHIVEQSENKDENIKLLYEKVAKISDEYNIESEKDLFKSKELIKISDIALSLMRNITQSEVAFLNSGGISDNEIEGSIKNKHINAAIKYKSKIIKIILSGEKIIEILKKNQMRIKNNQKHLLISGISDNMINKRDIVKSEYYYVAINDFLLSGGDGFTEFLDGKQLKSIKDYGYLKENIYNYYKGKENIKISNTKKINSTLYWKYLIDINTNYQGNFFYNNKYYSTISYFAKNYQEHNLKTSFLFTTLWKNSYHKLTLSSKIDYELKWTKQDDSDKIDFSFNNDFIRTEADYEFNYKYASPYINVKIDNLKFYFVDDTLKNFIIKPQTGIRHHLPFNFFISESIVFDIYPFNNANYVNIGGKIGFNLPYSYKDIVIIKNDINFYFLSDISDSVRFNFIIEAYSGVKIKVFQYLYTNFDFLFYYDLLQNKPAVGINMNVGVSFLNGTINM